MSICINNLWKQSQQDETKYQASSRKTPGSTTNQFVDEPSSLGRFFSNIVGSTGSVIGAISTPITSLRGWMQGRIADVSQDNISKSIDGIAESVVGVTSEFSKSIGNGAEWLGKTVTDRISTVSKTLAGSNSGKNSILVTHGAALANAPRTAHAHAQTANARLVAFRTSEVASTIPGVPDLTGSVQSFLGSNPLSNALVQAFEEKISEQTDCNSLKSVSVNNAGTITNSDSKIRSLIAKGGSELADLALQVGDRLKQEVSGLVSATLETPLQLVDNSLALAESTLNGARDVLKASGEKIEGVDVELRSFYATIQCNTNEDIENAAKNDFTINKQAVAIVTNTKVSDCDAETFIEGAA